MYNANNHKNIFLCTSPFDHIISSLMDSASRAEILAFIRDFDLKKPGGVVSFSARVDFEDEHKTTSIKSEIQIITSDNLEAVYLMNPEIINLEFPDTFTSLDHSFAYLLNTCLQITGAKTLAGSIISVFPEL